MSELEQQLQSIKAESDAALAGCADQASVDQVKTRFLGRKGAITAILEKLGTLPKEDRPRVGKVANEIKTAISAAIAEKLTLFEASTDAAFQPSMSPCRDDGIRSANCTRSRKS